MSTLAHVQDSQKPPLRRRSKQYLTSKQFYQSGSMTLNFLSLSE